MDDKAVLTRVKRALDTLIESGDRYGGLFPSMLNRATGAMLADSPPAIPGQRNGDRAHRGSNLIHDEATLLTMFALGGKYADAADRYLRRFATHCTGTESGLFPWGEHSYWDLVEDCVGNPHGPPRPDPRTCVHDHLRQAPAWLWEKLYAFNPRCVERFAEGLRNHWVEGAPREYCRHAWIDVAAPFPRKPRSCDFPRHSGFYILDLAFAWRATQREDFNKELVLFLDYWWEKRDSANLLLIESRTPAENDRFHEVNAPAQTLSLGASLLQAADLVRARDPELAGIMTSRAGAYIEGFFAAPHDLSNNVFVILCRRGSGEITSAMPVWGSVYGVWPASYVGALCLCVYRITRDPRLLEWAEAVGRAYAAEPLPTGVHAPAMDAGMGLGLLADLYDVTHDSDWLARAGRLAQQLLAVYFDDAPLPRGAAEIDWYESQMGPGFLLHGLARTVLLAQDRARCPLPPDYTGR